MVTTFANNLVRWRYLTLIVMLAVVGVFGFGATKLKLATDLEVFFNPGDPQMALYDAQRDTYAHADNLFFVVAPPEGDIVNRKTMMLIEALTARAWELPFSARVDSITNYQHTAASGDDLLVQPLVEDAENISHINFALAKDIALNEPTITKRLVSEDGKVGGVNITIHLPGKERSEEIPQAMAAARALRDEMLAQYPDHFIGIS